MKNLIVLVLFFCPIVSWARINRCDMDAMEPAIKVGIQHAIGRTFSLAHAELDTKSFNFTRIGPIEVGAEDPVQSSLPGLRAEFKSAKGTSFSLRSVRVKGDQTTEEHDYLILEGLAFYFNVEVTRDLEGFIVKKVCHAYVSKYDSPLRTLIVNDQIRVIAPLSDYLTWGPSPWAFEFLSVNEDMEL